MANEIKIGGWIYRDKYGIVHVVNKEQTAEKYNVGGYQKYSGRHVGGYPVTEENESLIVYRDNRLKHQEREYPAGEWPESALELKKQLEELGLY